jgi:hypothetical protein
MFGRRQLRRLVQRLTFLVTGLALILGVATVYNLSSSASPDDDRSALIDADDELADDADSLDNEDDLSDWLGAEPLPTLLAAPLAGTLRLAMAERGPPSPFLDPLTRPPLFA